MTALQPSAVQSRHLRLNSANVHSKLHADVHRTWNCAGFCLMEKASEGVLGARDLFTSHGPSEDLLTNTPRVPLLLPWWGGWPGELAVSLE